YIYISFGYAYVFLRISDDPSEEYYNVHIPSTSVDVDDEWGMIHTAVAQVFALIVQATQEASPAQDWYQKKDQLSP
ncbi:MAG: hypothetical protein FE78DRAFT_140864, partial [Acidomyces sp. 'richmondensis']